MITVLESVGQVGPASVAEIARACGMNRTVTHRLLNTLHVRGYVRRDEKGFVLGPMIRHLAERVPGDLMMVAGDIIRHLADEAGETVVLHSLDGFDAVVVGQAVADRHVVRVHHRPGERHPLVLGASGRAILAFQSEATQKRCMEWSTGRPDLGDMLRQVRELGWSMSHDELQYGVHGLAVPIADPDGSVFASVAILVPAARAANLGAWTTRLRRSASAIEAALKLQGKAQQAASSSGIVSG